MSTLSVARRYAAALFDVARKSGAEGRVGEQLAAFAGLVAGHADLQRAFENPAIPVTAKKALLIFDQIWRKFSFVPIEKSSFEL